MPNFKMGVILNTNERDTARIADGAGQHLNDSDVGKLVKLAGDSQYGLCAIGNEIEGFLDSGPNSTLHNGFYLGGVLKEGRFIGTMEGLQATGTGNLAVGDYVVAGTPVARNTALGGAAPKVRKATASPGTLVFKWRIVALDSDGSPGTTGVIEKVS